MPLILVCLPTHEGGKLDVSNLLTPLPSSTSEGTEKDGTAQNHVFPLAWCLKALGEQGVLLEP